MCEHMVCLVYMRERSVMCAHMMYLLCMHVGSVMCVHMMYLLCMQEGYQSYTSKRRQLQRRHVQTRDDNPSTNLPGDQSLNLGRTAGANGDDNVSTDVDLNRCNISRNYESRDTSYGDARTYGGITSGTRPGGLG